MLRRFSGSLCGSPVHTPPPQAVVAAVAVEIDSRKMRGAKKENGRNHEFRPSLNREASRLGDVRVRRPSSRALVPETIGDGRRPSETCGDNASRGLKDGG